MGAAYGTAKSGTGIAAMAVMRPEAIMKSIIPVVMAGIIAIYGVVVAVLIAGAIEPAPTYTLFRYRYRYSTVSHTVPVPYLPPLLSGEGPNVRYFVQICTSTMIVTCFFLNST